MAAIGAAREQPGAVYAAWPSLELTDRTLTGEQVKKLWHAIKSKYASATANVPSAPASPPEPAKHRKRATPMDERAEAAGVKYEKTPEGLREIIANKDASAAAKARHELKRHKTTMCKKVGRAEVAREKWAEVRNSFRRHGYHISREIVDSTDCHVPCDESNILDRLKDFDARAPSAEEHAREERRRRFENWLNIRKHAWRDQQWRRRQ